jgi:hypothetical protein
VFMLQRCLCNLLGWCLPGRQRASESGVVADAPAPTGNGQPSDEGQQRSASKRPSGGGKRA